MNLPVGKIYRKLRTRLVRIRVREPYKDWGAWTTTHDHEIDEEGDLVVAGPHDRCDIILSCPPDKTARVLEDRLELLDKDARWIQLQFLETRPRKKLQERVLLG